MSERIAGNIREKLGQIDFILEGLKSKKKFFEKNIKFVEEFRRIVYVQLLNEIKMIKDGD